MWCFHVFTYSLTYVLLVEPHRGQIHCVVSSTVLWVNGILLFRSIYGMIFCFDFVISGWKILQSDCFYFVNVSMTWHDADQACHR